MKRHDRKKIKELLDPDRVSRPPSVHWFDCFFGHRWTKWEDAPPNVKYDGRVGVLLRRECTVCGRPQYAKHDSMRVSRSMVARLFGWM